MSDWFEEWLDHVPDLAGLAQAFPDRFPYLLESSAHGPLGGHSLLLLAGKQKLVAQAGAGRQRDKSRFFDELTQAWEAERTPSARSPLPFLGGWFLYFGYEMAEGIETTLQLPANTTGLPDAIAHRCPAAIIVLHGKGAKQADRACIVSESPEALDEIRLLLKPVGLGARQEPAGLPALAELTEDDPEQYRQAVRRIHDYLAAGDVFQVNVSRQWRGRFSEPVDPVRLYRSLMQANPAPFAGLMRNDGNVLLSSSPERLVQLDGDHVQTRPIAGTRPRGQTHDSDEALSRELISNLKERAEHVMLIDLERNDLGRVCKPGSVEVNELMVVESYAHVHHIVSNVRGSLRDDAGPVDAIKAVFPGGTITGCPKVRCMEIIAELEGEGRGFYTGSMGFLGRDGRMDLNILIRSVLTNQNGFSFRTGAGIVVDSDPDNEVNETSDKARGLLLAVQGQDKEKQHARMPG